MFAGRTLCVLVRLSRHQRGDDSDGETNTNQREYGENNDLKDTYSNAHSPILSLKLRKHEGSADGARPCGDSARSTRYWP